jgi:hypothetical protein
MCVTSEYKLWTDESSRTFIEQYYPWFLDTYDGYTYPIQRADAIRYFVLHHYGGVYMDLDVGCMRRMDPLLQYDVILPKTIPVGVSNDLMFASKGHPFMEQTIRHLINFDHSWILNYPTVMFSTGPMFLSVQYGIWTAANPPTPANPGGSVRVLPKSLYGKNARVDEAPNAFFSHHYGSSWHADDAAFITFLGRSGMHLMWVGFFILLAGMLRLLIQSRGTGKGRSLRRRLANARYYLLLPRRVPARGGNVTLDILGPAPNGSTNANNGSPTSSPTSSRPSSPSSTMPLLPYSFETESASSNSTTVDQAQPPFGSGAANALYRAGAWARSQVSGQGRSPRSHRGHSRSSWGSAGDMLFFLPALLPTQSSSTPRDSSAQAAASRQSDNHDHQYPPPSKYSEASEDLEAARSRSISDMVSPPPPYVDSSGKPLNSSSATAANDEWAFPQTPASSSTAHQTR